MFVAVSISVIHHLPLFWYSAFHFNNLYSILAQHWILLGILNTIPRGGSQLNSDAMQMGALYGNSKLESVNGHAVINIQSSTLIFIVNIQANICIRKHMWIPMLLHVCVFYTKWYAVSVKFTFGEYHIMLYITLPKEEKHMSKYYCILNTFRIH